MSKPRRKDGEQSAGFEVLLASVESRYELVVAWDPGWTQPVKFVLLMATSRILIADRLHVDSPVVLRRLPDPDATGKIEVIWTITPEVPLRAMAMAIVDRQTGARTIVAKEKDLERGQVWRGTKVVSVPKGC